jgi:hypothetical protein
MRMSPICKFGDFKKVIRRLKSKYVLNLPVVALDQHNKHENYGAT